MPAAEERRQFLRRRINADPLSADLQWSLFKGALQSYRFDTVLRPFPPSFCLENGEKDIKRLVTTRIFILKHL